MKPTTFIIIISIALIFFSISHAEHIDKTIEWSCSKTIQFNQPVEFPIRPYQIQHDFPKKKPVEHIAKNSGRETNLAPPSNDNFADSVTITGPSGTTVGSNVDATMEPGEQPILSYTTGSNSVWWTWTCPTSGLYGFDTIGSDYDTLLGIFSGDSVNQLTKLAYDDDIKYYNGVSSLDSYVGLNATAGQTYQIAVAGYAQTSEGNITLNWYPDTFYIYSNVVSTSTYHEVRLANNGNALDAYGSLYTIYSWETNSQGIIVNHFLAKSVYTKVNVSNKKTKMVVLDGTFSGIQDDQQTIIDFDGKSVLVTSLSQTAPNAKNIHLYKVTGSGLKKMGSYTISNNYSSARLTKKWIYVSLFDWNTWNQTSLLALDKKLKKTVWEVPMSQGLSGGLFDNGVLVLYDVVGTNANFYVTKKGKPYGSHTLPIPSSSVLYVRLDRKGGILYWLWKNGTNESMTYLDRKGKKVVENFSPDNFSTSTFSLFNGRVLLFGKIIPGNGIVQSYNWGKKPKKNGETTVPSLTGFNLDNSKIYFKTYTNNTFTTKEFDKKLTKTKWENSGPGFAIVYLGKGVFYRYNVNGSIRTYTIFKKEKTIVEHTYTD